jgi:hypothetical protein
MTITQDLQVRSLIFGRGLVIILSSLTSQISSHLLLFYSLNYQYFLEYVMQITVLGVVIHWSRKANPKLDYNGP